MAYTFDGINCVIQLTAGTTELDVKDLYSRWKDWVQEEGSKFGEAMESVGGDPVDVAQGIYVSTYIFLKNGWRIRPQENNHRLRVFNGILLTATGDDPFVPTQGYYNVLVQYSQPIATQSSETGVSGLTEEESQQLAKALTVSKFLALK